MNDLCEYCGREQRYYNRYGGNTCHIDIDCAFCVNGGPRIGNPMTLAPAHNIAPEAKQLRGLKRALSSYTHLTSALMQAETINEVAQRVCEAVLEFGDYALVMVGIANPNMDRQLEIIGGVGVATSYLDDLKIGWSADAPEGQGPTGIALRNMQPQMMDDALTDASYLNWRDRGLKFGIRSSLVIPFKKGDDLIGAINIYATRPHAFGEQEIRMFGELANELVLAIALNQKHELLKSAKNEAQAAQFEYQTILATTSEGFLICTSEGYVIDVNPAYCRMSGYTRDELIGMHITDLDAYDQSDEVASNLDTAKAKGSFSFISEHRRKDGSFIPLQISISYASILGDRFYTFYHDLTDRYAAEASLRRLHRSKQGRQRDAIEAHKMLVSVSEQTLRQIGQDLHDDIGQILAGGAMLAMSLKASIGDSCRENADAAGQLATLLGEATTRLRTIAQGLYPTGLDATNLPEMLADLTANLRKVTPTNIKLSCGPNLPDLDSTKLLHIYRIVQEASSNVIRHSGASEMTLECRLNHDTLRIRIIDNGVSMRRHRRGPKGPGLGLTTMKARASEIGGTLRISCPAKGGTCVELKLPLETGVA